MKFNELQLFVKNIFFCILSSIFVSLINIAIISYYSKVLLVEGFGNYNFLLTYSSYFFQFVSLGIDIVAMRYISIDRSRTKEIYGALVPLKVVISVAVFCVMLLPMLFVQNLYNYGVILIIFSIPVLTVPFSAQSIFEAHKRLEIPSIVSIIVQILNLTLVLLLVNSPEDLIVAGVITVIVHISRILFHNIIFLKLFGMWKLNFDKKLWKNLISSGAIIGCIQILFTLINYLNVFMLEFMKDSRAVGLYSAAYRGMFLIVAFMGIFHNLMYPILFENFKKDFKKFKSYFNKYFKFIIYFGFGIFTLLMIFSREYLNIFFNLANYNESVACFNVIMISLFFLTLCAPLQLGMLAAHKEKTILYISIFQFIGNIIGNYLLIPKYGIMGAAAASVATAAIGLLPYVYAFNKICKVKFMKNSIIGFLSALTMGIFLYFVPIHYIVRSVIGVFIMIIMVLVLKGYTILELKNIKKTFFKFKSD